MKEACGVGDVSKALMFLSFKVIKITNNINEGYGLNDWPIELASEFTIMLHIKRIEHVTNPKKKSQNLMLGGISEMSLNAFVLMFKSMWTSM